MTAPVGGIPPVEYADSDGLNIAYQVVGSGPVDIVLVPGFISHIEYAWHEPSLSRFMRKLSAFARVICFDKRGMGLSDRDPGVASPTLEQRVEDIRAVLDAAGSRSAGLLAWSEGGPASIQFAHTYPDRAAALILIATTARFTTEADYPEGVPLNVLTIFIETLRDEWGSGIGFELHAPSRATDARTRAWWASYQRLAASPGAVEASMRMQIDVDVRKLLPEITQPALVVHQTQDMVVPVECGRHLAAHIPGAVLLEQSGEDHLYWLGDQDEVLDAIRRLMAETPGGVDLMSRRRPRHRSKAGWESLTEREVDVIRLISVGLTDRQIGERLFVSPRTVSTHVTHVLAKLDLRGRVELAAEASRHYF